MPSIGPELAAEGLQLVLYAAVGVVLTVGGAFAEYNSLQHLGAGETVLAAWFALFGAVLLYAGVYGLAYKKVVRTLA